MRFYVILNFDRLFFIKRLILNTTKNKHFRSDPIRSDNLDAVLHPTVTVPNLIPGKCHITYLKVAIKHY
jgi:hypothetical protein